MRLPAWLIGATAAALSLAAVPATFGGGNTAGLLDTSFDGDGRATVGFAGTGAVVLAAAVQADDKIVVAGLSNTGDLAGQDFGLARFGANGAIDATFGAGGATTTDFKPLTGGGDQAFAVAIQPADQFIVVAGRSWSGGAGGPSSPNISSMALARYTTTGALDSGFGASGKVVTSTGATKVEGFTGLAVQSDLKIVAVGTTTTSLSTPAQIIVARYTSGGTLDPAFGGGDGLVTIDFGAGSAIAKVAIDESAGRRILVGTSAAGATSSDFKVARLDDDGDLDATFAGDGIAEADFGATDGLSALALGADGKAVAAGTSVIFTSKSKSTYQFAAARLNADGTLDTSFDTDGKLTRIVSKKYSAAAGVLVQPDGGVVICGSAAKKIGKTYLALLRYLPDGTPDTTFGKGGVVKKFFVKKTFQRIEGLARQSDGKLIVGGSLGSVSPDADFLVARFLAE